MGFGITAWNLYQVYISMKLLHLWNSNLKSSIYLNNISSGFYRRWVFLNDTFPSALLKSPLHTFFWSAPVLKGIMSHFYSHVHSFCLAFSNSIKELWEMGRWNPRGRLGGGPSVEFTSLSNVQNTSRSMCKIMHHGHPINVRLAKIYKDVDLTCDG